MKLGLGLGISRAGGGAGGPYAAFDQYVAVSSAADYTIATGVNRWINRAPGGATYDWLQATAGNQPTAAVDGLDFDNTDDYMRCAKIATDLQAYIALSQHPNLLIMHQVTLTDGGADPPKFVSDHTYWSCAPLAGSGFLWSQMLGTGRFRRSLRNTLNATVVTDDLILPPGDVGPGTYTIAEHFHDAVLDTYYAGALASTVAFDFTPLFTANNPFGSANFTMGVRLVTDSTVSSPLSGRVKAFAYKRGAASVPVFP